MAGQLEGRWGAMQHLPALMQRVLAWTGTKPNCLQLLLGGKHKEPVPAHMNLQQWALSTAQIPTGTSSYSVPHFHLHTEAAPFTSQI